MDALTLDRALDLARTRGGHRVSLFMPTHRFGPGSQEEDTTRLRNLLRTAEEDLAARGVRAADVARLLAPARALVEDRPFWLRSENGLALLIGPEGMDVLRLRTTPPEMVRVGDRYHVRPLLSLVDEDDTFWLLAISQKSVRLYAGSRAGLVEASAEGVPVSLADATRWDDFEKDSLQFHSDSGGAKGGPTGGGHKPAVFHGTGETQLKDELVGFMRAIDHGLREHLRESEAPLILAAVEYLHPIYRDVNTYPHLAEPGIAGNPDALTLPVLLERSLAILDERADDRRRRLAAQVEEAWGSAKTTPDPETIVAAADGGRVDTLLLTEVARWWGTYDPDTGRVIIHTAAANGDEDLLDVAALRTLENGGSVVSVAPDAMPRGEAAVALMRY